MIYIDAREGLSGDMLLAAMIGLLDKKDKTEVLASMSRAAGAVDVEFHIAQMEDSGEKGLGITYSRNYPESVGRSYAEALDLLNRMRSPLEEKHEISTDRAILDILFSAEAKAHAQNVNEVHLHEVGRASAILNMFGIGQASSRLKKAGGGDFACSTITTGKGIVVVSHGAVRVPAPACRLLLEGLRHVTGSEPGERATPTGLAVVAALISSQTDDIPSDFRTKSVGFGTRRFSGRLGRTVLFWT